MSIDWQFAITFGAIALAIGYFGRRAYRTWRSVSAGGCAGGCGCAKASAGVAPTNAPTLVPVEQLKMRSRR